MSGKRWGQMYDRKEQMLGRREQTYDRGGQMLGKGWADVR
jgi:hypothetical protein